MKATLTKKLITGITRAVKKGVRFSKENSNFILTALAVLGVTITAEELVRATIKAVKICEEKQVRGGKNVLKTVWKIYIPAAGFFLITTITILGNAHLNARKLATVTGLCALQSTDLRDLKDKVKEVVGPKKEKAIEDEIVKDKLKADEIPPEEEIIKTGHGDQLFKEWITGKYIRTSPEYVELVEERLNREMADAVDQIVTVKRYLQEFNLDPDCMVSELFWDQADMNCHGDSKIGLNVVYNGWKEVRGKQEMVAAIKPNPWPMGL